MTFAPVPSILFQRIKNKRKRRPALPAVLRAEGEEDDLAFAVAGFGEGCLSVDLFFAEHPARKESVFGGISGDYFDVGWPS